MCERDVMRLAPATRCVLFYYTVVFFVVAVVYLETVAGSVQTVSASSIIVINEFLEYLYVMAGQPSTSTVLLLHTIRVQAKYSHVDRTAENECCTRTCAIMYTCTCTCNHVHVYTCIMPSQRRTSMSTHTVLPTDL